MKLQALRKAGLAQRLLKSRYPCDHRLNLRTAILLIIAASAVGRQCRGRPAGQRRWCRRSR